MNARKVLEKLNEDDSSLIWYLLVNAYAELTGDIPKEYKVTNSGYTFDVSDFNINHLKAEDVRDLLRRVDK